MGREGLPSGLALLDHPLRSSAQDCSRAAGGPGVAAAGCGAGRLVRRRGPERGGGPEAGGRGCQGAGPSPCPPRGCSPCVLRLSLDRPREGGALQGHPPGLGPHRPPASPLAQPGGCGLGLLAVAEPRRPLPGVLPPALARRRGQHRGGRRGRALGGPRVRPALPAAGPQPASLLARGVPGGQRHGRVDVLALLRDAVRAAEGAGAGLWAAPGGQGKVPPVAGGAG
mmetsp:Transcript_38870/g.116165  ORF Transcript_38870/g.116165 Transcript_38870/m.116165 type:complete len:226 (-) Transcript_38870:810-1487(-)